MATIQNDRDVYLQAAGTRVRPITLPSNITVPPAQLGSGSLPSGVLTPSGNTFGALAGQNLVNLTTQATGFVDANTQVTNLGNLAYINVLAANAIGAGTLSAGVIYTGTLTASQITTGTLGASVVYTGTLNASQITAGTITGRNIQGGSSIYILGTSTSNSPGGMYSPNSDVCELWCSGLFEVRHSGSSSEVFSIFDDYTEINHPVQIRRGVYNNSWGLDVLATSGYAPLRLRPQSALPTDKSNGSYCDYSGTLCRADGTNWRKVSDGTIVT